VQKEKIIVIGCGEHAKLVLDNLEDQNKYEVFGLTTIIDEELNQRIYGYPVVCKDSDIQSLLSNNSDIKGYILGVGKTKVRHKLYTWLDEYLEAVNIIHPSSIISKHAQIGKGNLIEIYTRVANGAIIGNHCMINPFSSINHDQILGDNVYVCSNVTATGNIGSHTIISDGVSVGFKKNVGSHCMIADGTVVNKNVPDHTLVYGNPPKMIPNKMF